MFISRKKYEEDLERAFKDGCESVWEKQRAENCMNEIHRRMDEVCKRLSRLEEAHQPVNVPEEATTRPRYCFGGIAIDA